MWNLTFIKSQAIEADFNEAIVLRTCDNEDEIERNDYSELVDSRTGFIFCKLEKT